ncbi:hypothetical protein C5D07_08010 [Rathayibacter tritici]|uniref:DUF5719 family protein n=1 Tax=Rathayibacter tritici TaxID=33888 RepID=UPI000CE73458|nr:DUF5719 family protein [Rathayibacter tritici]PPF31142.1 hypothetical protein C5C06_02990 [Rathayibacter tritici]PPI14977.1 hypothetical protein C5D07_08010 [Rathayibacter tritici]
MPESSARRSRAERRAGRAAAATPQPAPSAAHRRRTALRSVVGVAGVVIAAAAVAVPQLVPTPLASRAAQGVVVSPVAADASLVCGGDLIDASEPEQLRALDGSTTALWPDGSTSGSSVLGENDIAAPSTGITGVQVPADSAPTPGGASVQVIATATLSGLSARACAEPSADSWLVAGSTDVGRTSVLILANPSAVAATVDLTLFGENGRIQATGATGIVVPAGAVRALPLAGLAPGVVQPVVHVTARGGEVAASMQSSAISGLTPEGVETTGPSAGPDTLAVIAGLEITSPPTQTASDDGSGGAGTPVLRILTPGDADSTVSVEVTNADPSGSGTSTQVVVPAGLVGEVPLTGLADGSYRVVLRADQPIVAAGRTTSTGPAGTDFAWFASGSSMTRPFGIANTGEGGARLHLINGSDSTASVVIAGASGSRTLELGPFGALATPLGTDSVVVTSTQPVQASVSIAGDGKIASYAVVPPGPLSSPITVYSH